MVRIGVLALQGAFSEHEQALQRCSGVTKVIQVRTADDLNPSSLDGLIIPGGESTTMVIAAQRLGLWHPLCHWISLKKPTMVLFYILYIILNVILAFIFRALVPDSFLWPTKSCIKKKVDSRHLAVFLSQ
jgi:SNO glutamine amidotransferase family